jgi:DNA-directed RNA polymerase specialized sigma subunit
MSSWETYLNLARKYQKIPLSEERLLIAQAKKGSQKSTEEIVLRHIGFVIFRIHKRAFPEFLRRFGEDLLSDSIPILHQKIKTYNLKYRDKNGNPKPVKFASYIWKRIDGFILDSLKKEIMREQRDRCNIRIHDADFRSDVSEILDDAENID